MAALVALIAVEGQPVAATHATAGPSGRMAEIARRQAAAPARAETVANEGRPDFRVTFTTLDDAQAGRPFSYTIQVRNDGTAAGVASVSAVVPPELSNVRVNAPGFVCTRRFTPGGSQAGTLVTCMRNDLDEWRDGRRDDRGERAERRWTYHLTAVADPRDEVDEADEGNNAADVTVQVQANPSPPILDVQYWSPEGGAVDFC